MPRVKILLKSRAGASMLFVLAAMFLLLAVGVSAVTAAGASVGAWNEKRVQNQLYLFNESTQRVIKAQLEDGGVLRDLLLEEIENTVIGVMRTAAPGVASVYTGGTLSYTMTPSLGDDPWDKQEITIKGEYHATYTPYEIIYGWVYNIYLDDYLWLPVGEELPEANVSSVGSHLTVTVETLYTVNGKAYTLKTEARYSFEDIHMKCPPRPDYYYNDFADPARAAYDAMYIDNTGKWEITSYKGVASDD